MIENIDVGFVSLAKDYYQACVPSKIYEYINLGLPMIGALPGGDSVNIINDNNYGIACKYNDINSIVNSIVKLQDKEILTNINNSILKDRKKWYMKNKILELNTMLKKEII